MQRQKNRMMILITGCLIMTAFFCGGCADRGAVEIDMLEPGQQMVGRYETESDIAEGAVQGDLGNGGESGVTDGVQNGSSGAQEDEPTHQTDEHPIFVQVNGAVNMPGVYQMEEGGRVFQAIEKAGGLTNQAAAESLNQAAEVTDGQVITVYTNEEWEEIRVLGTEMQMPDAADGQGAVQQDEDGRVNINTADLDALCTIPGIGQTRAESIISYRNEQGAFEKIEDIKKVSGIKDGLFDKIKDKIKV